MAGNKSSGRHKRLDTAMALVGDIYRPDGLPQMPASFIDRRRGEIWVEVLASVPAGQIARCDAHLLASFCIAVENIEEAQRLIDESGHLVRTKAGIVRNPALMTLHQAQSEMRATGSRLGLDPIARVGIPKQGAEKDIMEELLDAFDAEPVPGRGRRVN